MDNNSKIVPDFILGENLVRGLFGNKPLSGESQYYTVEQKPGESYILGMNSASYVKDTFKLEADEMEIPKEVWFDEEADKYRKESKAYNKVFKILIGALVTISVLCIVLSLYL